jgi:lysophospholipase L1-like esterase
MVTTMRSASRSTPGRVVAGLAALAALFCVFQLALIAISGGEPAPLLWFIRPRLLLAQALLAAAVAWLLLSGVHRDAAGLREAVATFALAAASTIFAFLLAEAALRIGLWRLTSSSRLEDLDRATNATGLPPGEIVTRHSLALIIRRSPNERLIYELAPNLDLQFGEARVRTNSAGMRSDLEFATGKPAGTLRVVGIGDSGMFGWNVEPNEDYVTVLGKLLNARGDGRRYETLNLAVPGYNTQMEVDALIDKGLRYRPDIVVVGWCENDYQLPFMLPQIGQWTRRDVSFLWLLIFRRQEFSNSALVQINDLSHADREHIPEFFRENSGVKGVRQSLLRLRELAAKEGFHVVVFGPLKKGSEAMVAEVGLPAYNTYEKLPKGTWPAEYNVHFMHPAAGGHRLLAQSLAGEFERRGWLLPVR